MSLPLRHHRLDGHEFDQALGVGDGQGSHWCASFQAILSLGNRCCSNIAWCLRGPHSQAANCQ